MPLLFASLIAAQVALLGPSGYGVAALLYFGLCGLAGRIL